MQPDMAISTARWKMPIQESLHLYDQAVWSSILSHTEPFPGNYQSCRGHTMALL